MTLLTEIYDVSPEVNVDPIVAEVDELIHKLAAAKRGLGLANKLSGIDKSKHQKRILGNLNRIRSRLNKLINELQNLTLPQL